MVSMVQAHESSELTFDKLRFEEVMTHLGDAGV
jgi:hypothetical protein